jgi:hypothetical protein
MSLFDGDRGKVDGLTKVRATVLGFLHEVITCASSLLRGAARTLEVRVATATKILANNIIVA